MRVVREPSVWVKRTDPFEEESMLQVHIASHVKMHGYLFRRREQGKPKKEANA